MAMRWPGASEYIMPPMASAGSAARALAESWASGVISSLAGGVLAGGALATGALAIASGATDAVAVNFGALAAGFGAELGVRTTAGEADAATARATTEADGDAAAGTL
jgi:hypothetical protein